jgi:uncharacterized membrane protein YeaQ/YmgE (transglycosylase-associated protein family)
LPVSVAWMIMSGIFAFWLFTNVVLGVIAGAFLGRWIIEGLRAFGFRV